MHNTAMRVLRSYVAVTPSPGGMERHINELSVHQRRLGINVVLMHSAGKLDDGHGVQVLGGLPILHLRPHALRDLIFYVAVLFQIWRRRIRADVFHIHGDWSAFLAGRAIKRLVGANVLIASVHGHLHESGWKRPLYRLALRGYGAIYATGVRESGLLTMWSQKKCEWITSGVSDCFFTGKLAAPKKCDVLIVGSIVPVKGMDLVVETARVMPGRQFRIVGDGPDRRRLQVLASQVGAANLHFVGSLPPESVVEEYAGARVLLLTSLEEGTPTAILEAMAIGLPIVTTASNDYSRLLGGNEGGIVVESRDAASVASAIETFLADDSLAIRVGERNRAVARQYTWPAVARRVTCVMEAALKEAS